MIDCGTLTPTIVESQMFGHAKGSFTGADTPHEGKFTAVGGGTLMIDEIDALPLTTQTKLLRAVDERVFEPVGSNKVLPLRAELSSRRTVHLRTRSLPAAFAEICITGSTSWRFRCRRCANARLWSARWWTNGSPAMRRTPAARLRPFRPRPCKP